MTSFIIRRLLWMIPVLGAAATLVWVFMFLIPGDPARILAGQRADPDVLAQVRNEWGLDRPAPVRYAKYLWKLAHLDLGVSYVQHGRKVSEIILEGMWRTFFLAITATVLAALLGLSVGALSAAFRGTFIDAALLGVGTAGIALPTFWLGLMLILVFASWLGWFPVSGYSATGEIGRLGLPSPAHLVLPSFTLAIFSGGYLSRVARASLVEESSQEYARAARARGASSLSTLMKHTLSNSLLPIITLLGLNFGALLGGAIATETVFNWPGLGSVMYRALSNRDLPVVEGGAIALTAAFLLVNLAVDLSYGILDPRTRD